VLMAFSIGGEYAKAEAYTFHDIAGLVTVGSSPPNFVTPLAAELEQSSAPDCRKQDRHKLANGSGPPGYALANISIAQKVLFYGPDRDPRDAELLAQGAETSPCGIFTSGQNLLKADLTGVAKINVPVLLTYGQHDGLVGTAGGPYQMRLLTGTKHRRLMIFPGVGHAWFLERQRVKWTDVVVGWLEAHGL
jgi:pimeloyl-ACP methyl ester carboxylesterase